MLKKAFTLIELIGVLIILAIISLITIPIIDRSLENSRQAAYKRAVDSIIDAAKNYSVSNDLGYSSKRLPLFVSQLQDGGFLTLNIKSPIDESEMNGCVWYYWDESHKQYIFEYDNECVIEDPSIDILYNADLININGWAKENIATTLVGTGEIKYCIGTTECVPTETVVNGSNTKFITDEGTSYICASSTNILGESTSLCKNFKLDKTAPTIDGLELITVDRNESVDLNSGVIVDDSLSGIDGTYTVIPNSVDTSIAGIKTVTYQVSDMAGNVTTKTRMIDVLGDVPTIVFNNTGSFNQSGWANKDFYVQANITDNSGKGIKSIKWCSTTGESCIPTVEASTINALISNESTTNKVCVEAIDNNGKSANKCSENYKLDKKTPEIISEDYINVDKNVSHIVLSDLTVNFGISGGNVICDYENTSSLSSGIKMVSCAANGNNDLSKEKKLNYLIDDNVQSGVTSNTTENINVWSQFGTKKTYSLGDAVILSEGSTSSYTKSGYMAYSFDSNTGQIYLSDYQTKSYPIQQGSGYLNSRDYFYSKSGNYLNVTYLKYWKTISYTNYRVPILENVSIDTGLSYKLKDWTLVNSGSSSSYTVSNKYSSYSFDSGTGEIYLSGYTSSKTYPTGGGENSHAYYYYKVGDTLYCLYIKYWKTVSWDLYSTTVEENDNPTTSYSLGDAVLLSENEYSSYTVNGLYAGYSFDSGSGTVYLSNYTKGKTYPTGSGENSWAYYYSVSNNKLYVTYIKYWQTVSVTRYEVPIVEDETPRFTSTSVYSTNPDAYPDNDYSGDYYYDLMASGLSTAIYVNKKPISQVAKKGDNVLFTVELSNESNNYNKITYQWYKSTDGSNSNGEILNGETNPQLSISATDSGYYYCEITNTVGEYSEKLTTNAAYLKIIE